MLSLFTVFESAYKARVYAEDSSTTESSVESSTDSSSEDEETEESKYTDVLEDLQKDENFSVDNYPVDTADSVDKMEVIQIAESSDKELFVYVYQPNTERNYLATEIRMGFPVVNVETEYRDYDLTLLSRDGVFTKYLVEDVTVSDDVVRYYEIVQVAVGQIMVDGELTPIEKPEDFDQIVNSFPYKVAQKWAVYTLNGETFFEKIEIETVLITDKVVGFIRYPDGYSFAVTSVDAHFVAFSTDWEIERLFEADLTYDWVTYTQTIANGNISKSEYATGDDEFVSINVEDTGENLGDKLFGKKYTWERISTVSAFISKATDDEKDINFTDGSLDALKGKQWVLTFTDTEFVNSPLANNYKEWTEVSEVTILRLKFESNGKTYNLGVVDNKQTGSKEPLGSADTELDDAKDAVEDAINKILKALDDFFNGVVEIFTLIVYAFIFGFVIWAISKLIGWLISIIKNLFNGGKK